MPARQNTPKNDPATKALIDAARALLHAMETRNAAASRVAAQLVESALVPLEPPQPTEPDEMLGTLRIMGIERRTHGGGGTWVNGRIAGHRFEALVFPEHPESEAYELDKSRISKLWLKDTATGETVANFDRGWDVRPATDAAQQITDLLSAGLAEMVFGK